MTIISALKYCLPVPVKRAIRALIAWQLRLITPAQIIEPIPAPIIHNGQRWVDMAQIQTELAQAKEVQSVSEADYIRALQSFWVKLPLPPTNSLSDEYKLHWLSVYQSLAGNTYDVSRECHEFDLQTMINKPYPYGTESYEVVGNQLIAVGSLIKAMQLPPKASVLELGSGCGNTSLALAQMGHDVTTIDIEPRFSEILKDRATKLGVSLKVIQGDFFKLREITKPVDAILFYQSFHHCIDYLSLLDEIPAKLRPGGKLILAGETILEGLPYDWGLNPNGEAIFQIVSKGWMELCFRESYLLKVLKQKGWEVTKHDSTQAAVAIVYICTRANTQ